MPYTLTSANGWHIVGSYERRTYPGSGLQYVDAKVFGAFKDPAEARDLLRTLRGVTSGRIVQTTEEVPDHEEGRDPTGLMRRGP